MPSDVKSGYATYGALVQDELTAQDARKTSFEQRGITVITTSGVLATLLFGLAALSTKEAQTFVLPSSAADLLAVALVLFVVAAALALVTNVPLGYEATKVESIRARLKEDPIRDEDAAEKDIALTRLKTLKKAKEKNTIKGYVLIGALGAEVAAVGFVAAGVWQVIGP